MGVWLSSDYWSSQKRWWFNFERSEKLDFLELNPNIMFTRDYILSFSRQVIIWIIILGLEVKHLMSIRKRLFEDKDRQRRQRRRQQQQQRQPRLRWVRCRLPDQQNLKQIWKKQKHFRISYKIDDNSIEVLSFVLTRTNKT